MTDLEWRQLEGAIARLSDAEKRMLIDRIARSLGNGHGARAEEVSRNRRLLEEARRVAALPLEGPGGFSGADHDATLYGADSPPDP